MTGLGEGGGVGPALGDKQMLWEEGISSGDTGTGGWHIGAQKE